MFMPAAASVSPSFGVIAERLRRAGQLDRAVSLCRDGLALFPDYLAARVTLGYALMDQGLEREAHRELRVVLERAPDNLAAIRGLAELHSRGVEESDAHTAEFATMDLGAEAPAVDELPLLLAGGDLSAADERPIMAEPAALDTVTLPMFAVTAAAGLDEVAESIDPVMAPPVLPPAALEPLDPPIEPAVPAPILIESLDGFDDPLPAIPGHEASLSRFCGVDVDPALEPLGGPLQFEIEDVIDDAEEPPPFVFDEAFDEPVDLLESGLPDQPAVAAQPAVVSAEPLPVPELSTGPIALLDEWLTRIRARRSELLSEYAAG